MSSRQSQEQPDDVRTTMKACGGTLRGSRPGRHPPDLLPQAGGLHRDHPIHAKLPTPWRHSPRCVDDPRPIARTEGWGDPSKSGLPINLQSSDSWRRGQSRGPLGGARTPNPSLAGSIPAPRATHSALDRKEIGEVERSGVLPESVGFGSWRLIRGYDLACWCPPDEPCHADVLLELANRPR